MGDDGLSDEEFEGFSRQLDALVQEFEALPYPEIQAKAFNMLQAVDAIHREALTRLIGFLRAHGQAELVLHAAEDPIVHTLLLLYDLVPSEERTQVETALELVRPYIHSHGGEVEVLDVVDGTVHLRLAGSCHGCSGATMTLKRGIEGALREGFPGFKDVAVHEPEPDQRPTIIPLIPLEQVAPASKIDRIALAPSPGRPVRRPVFKEVARLDEVPAGTMHAFDVEGVRVLITNVAGEVYAVRNHCPGSMAPLDLGTFTPPIVICPWHNEAYDVRTGKRADGLPGEKLLVLPVAVAGGSIQVAVNTTADASAG